MLPVESSSLHMHTHSQSNNWGFVFNFFFFVLSIALALFLHRKTFAHYAFFRSIVRFNTVFFSLVCFKVVFSHFVLIAFILFTIAVCCLATTFVCICVPNPRNVFGWKLNFFLLRFLLTILRAPKSLFLTYLRGIGHHYCVYYVTRVHFSQYNNKWHLQALRHG